MFKRFIKPAPATPASPDRAYVKDRYTDKVIYAGTVAACERYVAAFGLCYVERY